MRVILLSMPWAIFNRPSIQLGALQGYLGNVLPDLTIETHHPYLEVAEQIGLDTYRLISEKSWAGEALYGALLFPEQKKLAKQLFQREVQGRKKVDFDTLLSLLSGQLTSWLREEDFSETLLIGFSVCFSQLPSSLYAARALKKHYPHVPIVFGGSTCTPALSRSLHTVFPEIDFVITGEGERPLHELVLYLQHQGPFPAKNVFTHDGAVDQIRPHTTPHNREVADLNDLPFPDFDDYFAELSQLEVSFIPELPLEFSRGCWWNKCTFCNLNLQWCGYRYKTHKRMLTELHFLRRRYQCLDFTFTDNALPLRETDRFFQSTADSGLDLKFFAEIRALQKPQAYHRYRKGGLRSVQIGIEALSKSLLMRMRKGVSVMENISAMKYATASSMALDGNLILEFPGSTEEEVNETLAVLDAVFPFRPLQAAGFFLGHGSAVCQHPAAHGIKATLQHPNNQKIYPPAILNSMEMLIKSYRGDRLYQRKIWAPVREKIALWQDFHIRRKSTMPALSFRDGGDFLLIRQERSGQDTLHHRLRGLSRSIYLACEQPIKKKVLLDTFNQIKEQQLSTFLNDLSRKKILFSMDQTYLSLAVRDVSPAS